MPRKKKYIGRTLREISQELLDNQGFALEWERRTRVSEIGKTIQRLRDEAKLTQSELANKSGLTQSVIARLESGDPNRRPRLDTLARIAAACGRNLVVAFL